MPNDRRFPIAWNGFRLKASLFASIFVVAIKNESALKIPGSRLDLGNDSILFMSIEIHSTHFEQLAR